MYSRGKLNCSVSDEISNKIYQSLVSMKVDKEEAYIISRQCRSFKEARSKVKIPERIAKNSEPAQFEEEKLIFPVSSIALNPAQQEIYQNLINSGVESSLAEGISRICDHMEEALLNAGLSSGKVIYKQREHNAGEFIYQKKKGIQEKCSICLDFYEHGAILKVLPCIHKFHQECINSWLNANHKKCPECLAEIKYD